MAVQLNHLIEATCTRGVKPTASTLFVVEGTLGDQGGSRRRDSGWLGRFWPLPGNDFVLRGYRVGSALLSLRSTRRLYGEFREVPRVLLQSYVEVGPFTRVVEAGVVILFCVAHLSWLVRRQRRPCKKVKKPSPVVSQQLGPHEQAWRIVIFAAFVYAHCLSYHVAGMSRPAGGRLMLVFAILGMDAILTDFKLDHVTS